jgi:hypothetical protein
VSSDEARHVLADRGHRRAIPHRREPITTLATVTLATHAACLQPGNIVTQSLRRARVTRMALVVMRHKTICPVDMGRPGSYAATPLSGPAQNLIESLRRSPRRGRAGGWKIWCFNSFWHITRQ